MPVYGKCECFVAQMYAWVLCAYCGRFQFCMTCRLLMLHGRGCKKRPYGRGILQIRSHDCLVGSHEYLILFTLSSCSE